jgi:hypothetical protein
MSEMIGGLQAIVPNLTRTVCFQAAATGPSRNVQLRHWHWRRCVDD